MPAERRAPKEERRLILQVVQPELLGLMDGSVSTLAPLFATAAMTARYPVEEAHLSGEV